jgi:uncharacterized oxidoreductase
MNITHERLREFATAIFAGAGCGDEEAGRVADHLVDANLRGHDSHGVIRVPSYVRWLSEGKVLAGRTARVAAGAGAVAVLDGQFGLGQTVGAQAIELGIEMSARHGAAVVALRNAGHLGRIGAYAEQSARACKVSLHFVNTTGAGILAAPFGGTERRLSANPVAAGVPVPGGEPLVLDISTCAIAEGKVRVALHGGQCVPEGCLIDAAGRPTTNPRDLYSDPPGAILPIAGHKGYGLAVVAEVLAGALTGGGCSDPANAGRLVNGMLSIVFDPAAFGPEAAFADEVARLAAWVKSSATVAGGEVLLPGEIEARTRARRIQEGIEISERTWAEFAEAAASVGVAV